jgi:hypothetical protein
MRVINNSHHDTQRCADWCDHVANPVDEVKERAFRLGRRLPLYRFVEGRLAPEILRRSDQGNGLREDDE